MADKQDAATANSVSATKSIPSVSAKAWVRGDNGLNWMLEMDGWYISYNPATSKIAQVAPMFGNSFMGDQEQETAICANGNYYILNGDFRREYENLSEQGLDACIAFFLSHPELKSSWSDTPPQNRLTTVTGLANTSPDANNSSSNPPKEQL